MLKIRLALAVCFATLDFAMAQSRPLRLNGEAVLRPVCQQFASALKARFATYKTTRQAGAARMISGGRSVTTTLRVGITIGGPALQARASSVSTAAASFRREQRAINRMMYRAGCRYGIRQRSRAVIVEARATAPRPVVISMR